MKTFSRLWQYPAEFFLAYEMFQANAAKKHTHFIFCSFLHQKIVSFMRSCRKMWWSLRRQKWQHNMAHARCMLDKKDYTHASTCICPRAREPTHTHTCTRAHTHKEKYVILLFHAQNGSANAPQFHVVCKLPVFFNARVPYSAALFALLTRQAMYV